MMCDILIEHVSILLEDLTIKEDQQVIIDKGLIVAINDTPDDTIQAKEKLDGSGKLLMPGLIDGHTHTCQQLLRGRTADEYPMVWTRFLVPFESNLTPEDSYISAKLACLEMIKNGTTGFADAGGVHMESVAKAVAEAGMRALLARSTMDSGAAITGAMKESAKESLQRSEALYQKYNNTSEGRIQIAIGMRQVMTCSPELLEGIATLAKKLEAPIHIHLCEHKDEVSFCLQNYQKRPAQYLADMGIITEKTICAHSVLLSEEDIAILANKQAKIIHCPRANLSNHGFPKTPLILQQGLSVGLGCDGAASSSLDLWEEMKILRYGIIAYWGLPTFNPKVLTCEASLDMAIRGGACAIGHSHDLGVIAKGKKADVILVNIDQPHLTPSQNLVKTIAACAKGSDVNDSIINGKLVMKDRRVLTMDEAEVRHQAEIHMNQIIKRAYN
ncbi:MAG: amidohydrolase [Erysipelotrichaceae bacterium]|jgi:5-methylthioadenosine/S-adenosylhomocysteine deaminase|nr:amidohydrolase [Erysipelotrichaceae bacterium]